MTVVLQYNLPFRLSDTTVVKMGIEGWVDSSETSESTPAVSVVDIRREYHRGFLYLVLPMAESELSDSSLGTLTQQLSESLGVSVGSPTIIDSIK
jgi:hypothetical protein